MQEEDSPALTVTAVPSLDLLSPSRTLSHAPAGPSYLFPSPFRALSSVAPGSGPAADRPPLFTPPSSGRKRALPPARMAVFGPRPPPLAIPDSGGWIGAGVCRSLMQNLPVIWPVCFVCCAWGVEQRAVYQ